MRDVKYQEIPGFPGYHVGSDGSVWSVRGRRVMRLRLQKCDTGYLLAVIRRADQQKQYGKTTRLHVHRLVLAAFVGPCPDGMECRHLDGNRANNRLNNLAWGTGSENTADRRRHGTMTVGSRSPSAKVTEGDIQAIIEMRRQGATFVNIGKVFGVSESVIRKIVHGKTWKHVPR